MDLERIRRSLAAPLDLDAAWRRYRGGGGMEDEDAFLNWLAAEFPAAFDAGRTRAEAPVEVSMVLPARFAPTDDAPTVLSERTVIAPRSAVDAKPAISHVAVQQAAANAATTPAATGPFHYVILGEAGKGGMGTVHIAKDTELLRRVALKQLNADSDANLAARSRFLREVQITAQLDHPNIVPVYALEVAPGGAPAYTMKFVEGTTFHALLNEAREFFDSGKFPDETRSLAARLEHFLKVCDAMAYAHDKGVIHRDLKPANLMLGRHNEVYVMDWGLCRVLRQPEDEALDKSMVMSSPDASGSASETQIGDVVGTPKYMSPEQAQGKNRELDARSDQCALGLILYEMATLNPPFDGRTAYEVLGNAATGKLRPLAHAYLGKRAIPRDLGAIIVRATAFRPEDRYASVADLAADLRRYLRGDAVLARPDNLWQRMQRAIARNRQRVLTGILALIALAALAIGGLLWQNQRLFKAERLREQRLLALTSAVADVSDRVQMRFLQLEGAIENLADSSVQLLVHGRPSEQKYYLREDFADPKRAPDDLEPSASHNGNISLTWPVWQVPAEADAARAELEIRKLAVLHPYLRDIYLRAARMIQNANVDFYSGREVPLTQDNSPLTAILIGLDDGVFARYPGWDALPASYDARTRPWFTLAKDKHGPHWGMPYANATTGLTELPLSVPLWDGRGHWVGVISAAFLPDKLTQAIFELHDAAAVRGIYLLDRDGHVLVAKGTLIPVESVGPDMPITQVFPQPDLLHRVHAGETGVMETTLRGQKVVIAYDEVAPFGWSVVAVADAAKLLKDTDAATLAF